ncbi:MAG: MFS transporter [Alphaproteobacteria bacterium]|nr:MFS transporter [Alphaproteobacteria bacterium]
MSASSASGSAVPVRLTPLLAARVFAPFALGYFLSYLGRVVNAVLAPHLIRDLGLDAADLGFLTSVYFLAFGLFQLPLGILLDRFGPRRANAGLLLIAAAGAFQFGAADSLAGLTGGRALIGLGVSACLMSAFTAYRLWFPKDRLPLVNGLQMAAGGLGALAGTSPVEAMLAFTDWRGVFAFYAVAALAAAAIVFMVVPERKIHAQGGAFADQVRGLAAAVRDPLFLRVAFMTAPVQGAFIGLQSLWVGPWLKDAAGLEGPAVAEWLFLVAAGMFVGYLSMGAVADWLVRCGVRVPTIGVATLLAFLAVQAGLIGLPPAAALPLWVLFTFFGASNVLWYSALSQSFPPELAGRVSTALNMFVFLGTFVCQWGVGLIVNRWPQGADGGYPAEAYRAALSVVLAVEIAGLAWYALMRRAKFRA